jgi:putative zinc finger/helix-turn-helix YgiT family protein
MACAGRSGEDETMDERRCGACGHDVRDVTETVSVALPRCGVVASMSTQARRCVGCGEVSMDAATLARVNLAIGRELADLGVHTGDALRHMRRALGLRASDLARLLGVTPETISHWETGKALASRAAFVAVAAMVEEALDGRTPTRDRLAVLADGRPYPRVLEVEPRARSRT